MRTLIDFGCGVTLLAAIYLLGNYVLYNIVLTELILIYVVITIITLALLGIISAKMHHRWTLVWMPILIITHPVGTSIYWFAYFRKKVVE